MTIAKYDTDIDPESLYDHPSCEAVRRALRTISESIPVEPMFLDEEFGEITEVTDKFVPDSGYIPFHDGYMYIPLYVTCDDIREFDAAYKLDLVKDYVHDRELALDQWVMGKMYPKIKATLSRETIDRIWTKHYNVAVRESNPYLTPGTLPGLDTPEDAFLDDGKYKADEWSHEYRTLIEDSRDEWEEPVMVRVYARWMDEGHGHRFTLGVSVNVDGPYYRESISWIKGDTEWDLITRSTDYIPSPEVLQSMVQEIIDWM